MTVFTILLFLAAGFLTIGVAANAGSLHDSDAAGNGMAQAFTWLFAIAEWLVLAILFFVCAARDGFPRYSGLAMLVAFPIAIAAQVVALQILAAEKAQGPAAFLLPAVTFAAPVLMILRAAWGSFPALRAAIPEIAGSWTPIVLLLLVSLVPFSFRPRYLGQQAARQAEAAAARQESERQFQAAEERRTQEALAQIAAIPTGSILFSALEHCSNPNPAIRDAARAKARTLVNRQRDAEDYISQMHNATLRELPNLDLTLTPKICEFAKKGLADKASIKPFDNDPIRIEDAELDVAPYIGAMRWLLAGGCDCRPEIAALDQAVRRYTASPRREKILADLASAAR